MCLFTVCKKTHASCLPTINFCGHITKWTNDIMSKPVSPHLDWKGPDQKPECNLECVKELLPPLHDARFNSLSALLANARLPKLCGKR